MLGHSVGEYVAAVVAGAMSLEHGLGLVTRRCELIDEKCDIGVGSMASIFAGQEQVKKAGRLGGFGAENPRCSTRFGLGMAISGRIFVVRDEKW